MARRKLAAKCDKSRENEFVAVVAEQEEFNALSPRMNTDGHGWENAN